MNSVSAESTPNQEKDQRTSEQQKIDSQLLYAIYQMRGEAEARGVPTEPIPLEKDDKGRVLVDIRVPVTKKVLARIEKLGGTVVSSSDKDHSIIAYLPLGKLEPPPLPQSLGNLAPGATVNTTVNFPNSTPGASSTLVVGGTYTGGNFGTTKRVTIP